MFYFFLLFVLLAIRANSGVTVSRCGTLPFSLKNSAAVYDNKESVYLLGGEINGNTKSDLVYQYNIEEETLKGVGEFPGKITGGAATFSPNGDIFHYGGYRTLYYRDIYQFNSTHKNPISVSKTRRDRKGFPAVLVKNKVYLIGGDMCDGSSCYGHTTIEEISLTPTTASNAIHQFDFKLHYSSAVYHPQNSSILIFGGEDNYYEPTNRIYRFDLATSKIELLKTRLPFKVAKTSAHLVDGIVYIISAGDEDISEIILFDVKSQKSKTVNLKFFAPSMSTSVYVPKTNKIYVFGTSTYFGGSPDRVTCVNLPKRQEILCTGKPDGPYPHTDCEKFIICSNENKHEMTCPDGLHFNPDKLQCDYPEDAGCSTV